MAGLCAAACARELGGAPVVFEKGSRPGGSMLLSSCVIWRFRDWDDFRAECPAGDERLQRLVWERFDDGIEWLESLGAPVVAHETGNPRTIGKRFDPRGLTETLVRAAAEVRLEQTTNEPTILATGGFQGDALLVDEYVRPAARLRLRANPWSTGDGLRLARARGAELSAGMDEFYGRNMPDADFNEEQFVPLAQLYGHYATARSRTSSPSRRHESTHPSCRSRPRPRRVSRSAWRRGSRTPLAACASTSALGSWARTAFMRQALTWATSRPAATRAASRRRSSSVELRRKPRYRPSSWPWD